MFKNVRNLTLGLIAAGTLALAPLGMDSAKADGWRGGRGWYGNRGHWGGGYRGYQRPYYGGGWYGPNYYRSYRPYSPYYYGAPYPGYYNAYGWGVRTPFLGVQVW